MINNNSQIRSFVGNFCFILLVIFNLGLLFRSFCSVGLVLLFVGGVFFVCLYFVGGDFFQLFLRDLTNNVFVRYGSLLYIIEQLVSSIDISFYLLKSVNFFEQVCELNFTFLKNTLYILNLIVSLLIFGFVRRLFINKNVCFGILNLSIVKFSNYLLDVSNSLKLLCVILIFI